MKPKPNPELVDGDNPEWSEADFRRAVPFSQLPVELRRTLASSRVVAEERAATERIPVRLSAEIVAAFKEAGAGWEARIDDALREWLSGHSPNDPAQESSN